MGYLESALTVPLETDRHVIYLPCHVHGGRAEMVEDCARLSRTLDALGGRRLVFASTAALYDGIKRPRWSNERMTLPPPRNWYLLTKRTQEEMVRLATPNAVILRLGAIVGPAPTIRWDLLPNAMVWRAVTTGEIPVTMPRADRPLLGITDAARAVEWATTARAGTYDILTANWPVLGFAEYVAQLCGARVVLPGEPPHVPSFTGDLGPSAAAGWTPRDNIGDLIDALRLRALADQAAAA